MTQLKRIVWFASIATPLLLLPCRIAAQSAPSSKSGGLEETTARSSRLAEEYARLPLSSEANTGQYHGNTNFGGSNSAPLSIVINAASTSYSTNTIPTGTGPIAAALNPTTHTLFVANQGSNNVTAIDTRTNSILATIPVDQAPSAIGVNTSTNQVYVANRDSADITIIDGATYNTTNIVVASVDVVTPPSLLPFHPIAIAVNQQTGQVYVGSTDCDFAVVTGNVVTHPGSFLCGPIALAVSPLTGRAFVAESHDSTIEEYQALTNFLLNGPGFNGFIAPQALAFNPPFAYAADGQGAVEEINEVTGANSHVTIAGNVYAIAANPVDGEVYAASQSSAAGQASNVTVISGNVVDVTLPVGQTPVPAPVPAPNKIAVDSTNHLVFVVNEASNDVTVIDVSALAVLSAVPVGTTPTAIVLNPERCNTYVTNFGSGTVTVLNPQSNGPGICLGSNSLTFPEQFVNTKSAPQTVTLTNIGNANLLISSIVTSPNVFIESDNCGPVAPATTSAIAPGAQCQIQAAFAPTTPGFVTGKILITDNATNSPQTIVLTGNAVLPPTVTLAVNANPAVFGQIVTLTARVAGSQGTPTGTVTFLDGQTVLDIRPLAADGTASITPTLSAVGVRNLTANYSGDLVSGPGSSAVLTETVNKAATQIIILSSSITSNVGASVTFETSIQIAPPGSGNAQEPGGQLAFYDGQTLLGSVPIKNATANFTTSSLSAGSHSITAVYVGDSNLMGSTSPVLTQIVNGGTGGGGTGGGGTGGGGGTNPPPTELVVAAGPNNTPFAVIDFTNPSSPQIVNPNPGYLGGSAVDCNGANAAVGNQNGGNVVTYDLSNPAGPAKLGSIDTGLGGIGAIKLDGNRVLVGEMNGIRVVLIDISNPISPVILSTLNTGITSISSVALSGSKAVVSGPNNITMDIVDYTDPAHPTRSSFDPKVAGGLPGLTVDLDGNLAAVGAQTNPQIALVDITGPTVLGTASSGLSGVAGAQNLSVSIKGPQVAVGSSNFQNVALIDFTNPSSPVVSNFDPDKSLSSGWIVSRTPRLLAIGQITGFDVELFGLSGNSATFLGKANSNVASPSTVCMLEINVNTTPLGNNVAVQPKDTSTGKSSVTVTFPAVNQAGQTSLTSSNSGPKPPDNFKLGSPATYYDLTTSALFTPPAMVCFSYAGVQYSNPSSIQLFHNVNNSWVPITTFNDTVNEIICGTVNSFSPFALFEPADTAPPVTTASLSAQPNAAGWNNGNITVTLSSTDSEPGGSGVKQITYSATGAQAIASTVVPGASASFTITTEGITTITFFGTDNAGNVEAPHTLVIRLDKTPPSIIGSRTPAPNQNGWNNVNVTVSFSCSDNLSGLAPGSPPANTLLSTEAAGQSVQGTCTDLAGNSASTTVSNINIDKTPPVLTITRMPLPNSNGWNNTDVTVSFAAVDTLSGVAMVSAPVTVTTEGAGQVVTGSATDLAGNLAVGRATVNIDKTPPEAFIQFDPVSKDVVLFGRDSLSGVAPGPFLPISVQSPPNGDEDKDEEDRDPDKKNDKEPSDSGGQRIEIRTYNVLDLAGNSLMLIEKVRKEEHRISARILSLQYAGGTVMKLPRNQESFEWEDAKDGTLKELQQEFRTGRGEEDPRVEATFRSRKKQTVIVQEEPEPRTKLVKSGLDLLRMSTSSGKLSIEF